MKLTDIMPAEKWAEIEKEFADKSKLTPAVFNAEGGRVTDSALWCNRLCPAIRKIPKALAQVCALAHQNMAKMAAHSRAPVVEECDAGMVKIVVPIFSGDEFIGAIGGCGRLFPDSEVEETYLAEISGLPAEEIHSLAGEVEPITEEEAQSLANHLAERVEQILKQA
jgi:ligand-binding sensor protein